MANEFDGIIDNVKKSAEEFVTLKVTTVIGKFDFDPASGEVNPKGGEQKVLHSEINIVDGDIRNYFDEAYEDATQNSIRQYHETQVAKAKDTVNNTIEAIKSLVGVLGDLVAKRDETEASNNPPRNG